MRLFDVMYFYIYSIQTSVQKVLRRWTQDLEKSGSEAGLMWDRQMDSQCDINSLRILESTYISLQLIDHYIAILRAEQSQMSSYKL